MSDGKIEIDTSINTDGAKKGVDNLKKTITSIKSANVLAGVTAATKAFKTLASEIDKTSKACNTQIKAEKQLEIAAKNNPYLDKNSVTQLKNYASELQKISVVGDETLLPLMSQLAVSGRTQAEIQTIMSAALDVSASGMMSLDSAVTQLNATYSGNIGLMGKQISELKDLTKEELESGKAIEIIGQKFKGMAKDVSSATGSFEQMKNAQGDFAEAVGKITKPTADVWNNFWKGWYEKGSENINKLLLKLDVATVGKTLAENISKEMNKIGDYGGINDYVRLTLLPSLSDEDLKLLQEYYKTKKELSENEQTVNNRIRVEIQNRQQTSVEIQKENAELEKQNKLKEEQDARNKTAQQIMDENQSALDKTIEKIKLEAEIRGEEVNEQEILNAMISSYIDLVTTSSLVTENNPFSKKRLEELIAYKNGMKELVEVVDGGESGSGLVNTMDDLTKSFTQLNDYFTEFKDIVSSAGDLAMDNLSATITKENAELQKQYEDGLISYQEFCDAKNEISKKQAQEEYKIKMWEWSSSLIQATANVAQGVTSALALTPPMSFIQAALVSAAGATQIASLTASKPQRPAFEHGGVVGGRFTGATIGSDNVVANLRNGELVLNASQQKQLWMMANGRTGGNGANISMPVTIENNNGSNVQTKLDANGLRIIVDNMVSTSMQQGKYTNSLNIANSKENGVRYL